MDRRLFYPLQIPLSSDMLRMQRNDMIAMGYVAEAVLGTPTVADGLVCTGMTPASLTVQVSPGQIYSLAPLDAQPFGGLFADTAHNIVKQGVNLDAQTFTLVPPAIAGQSVNWIIQAALVEADADNTVLSYVNPSNPSQPWTGPGNAGTSQPTTRKCTVALSAKQGVAATTGTQSDPAPDAGYVALYSVVVPYGATTLDSTNITQLDSAPFLFKKLPEIPKWVQSGAFLWGDDTGSANAIVARLTPTPTAYVKGMHVFIKKMASANTGAMTANFNGLGAVAVLDITGAPIGAGNMTASMVVHLVYDGAAFRWINGSVTNTTISSITATSGEGITVAGSSPYAVSLNFPGLSAATPTALDLFAFYDNEGTHHRNIQWQDLLSLLGTTVGGGRLINVQVITSSGTYTKTTGTTKAIAFAVGGGAGGGGGNAGNSGASGGGAGGVDMGFLDLSSTSTIAITIGAGGAGAAAGGAGADGGDTSIGALLKGTGGKAGTSSGEAPGGAGGIGQLGLARMRGGAGVAGSNYNGGSGGCNMFGGGGVGSAVRLSAPGGAGGAYGGGGGGGCNTAAYTAGGGGAAGVAIFFEFA